jgi:hypothetical protein
VVQAAPGSSRTLHIGSAAVTTDASGYVTVTHGAGFTPSVVIAIPNTTGGVAFSAVYGVDTFTSTTFRLRMNGVTGAVSFTVLFLCLS